MVSPRRQPVYAATRQPRRIGGRRLEAGWRVRLASTMARAKATTASGSTLPTWSESLAPARRTCSGSSAPCVPPTASSSAPRPLLQRRGTRGGAGVAGAGRVQGGRPGAVLPRARRDGQRQGRQAGLRWLPGAAAAPRAGGAGRGREEDHGIFAGATRISAPGCVATPPPARPSGTPTGRRPGRRTGWRSRSAWSPPPSSSAPLPRPWPGRSPGGAGLPRPPRASQFARDPERAREAFALAEHLGSVKAAAKELGSSRPALVAGWRRWCAGRRAPRGRGPRPPC
jgi:hypothetical protein